MKSELEPERVMSWRAKLRNYYEEGDHNQLCQMLPVTQIRRPQNNQGSQEAPKTTTVFNHNGDNY